MSTTSLIKTTEVCILRPERGSKFSPILVNDTAEKYYEWRNPTIFTWISKYQIAFHPTSDVQKAQQDVIIKKSRRLRTVMSLK